MVTVVNARDALLRRMEAVFSEENFGELFPDYEHPKVTLGFPTNESPFYVAVDEIAEPINMEGAVSMGHASLDFTLHVWVFARHKDLGKAADTLLAYIMTVLFSVLADQCLDYTVDNSFPRVDGAGTAADTSKRYQAAASIAINCSVGSVCPDKIKEIVDETNRN